MLQSVINTYDCYIYESIQRVMIFLAYFPKVEIRLLRTVVVTYLLGKVLLKMALSVHDYSTTTAKGN
jgi:hypothetical protein